MMTLRISIAIFLCLMYLCSWAQIGGDFNPENPSDPGSPVQKYSLTLTATPPEGGSFNFSNERMAVGSTNELYAYANTDFVFKHWLMGDSVLSTDQRLEFVMPAHAVDIVGVFEYNPVSPANPNANFWNPVTGEVILDDFRPGGLLNAVYHVLDGSNSDDVTIITVSGIINPDDFGIADLFWNCKVLDLSRVTGVIEVPSYAFDYTHLESVYLPAYIEKIGDCAFSYCRNLASVTLYSMTPPELGYQVFEGIPEGLVVYVPAAAISQYQDAEVWKDFTLLPIQEDIRNISVSLPAGANPSDYAQMWLELWNTKNGQRIHFVMTDRMQYTFSNIIRNTSWNVTLRNERGDIFGLIEDVEVKDDDVSVTFSSLSRPQDIVLSVLSPDGSDVTSQTQITWTDPQGNYLSKGSALAGLPVGYQAMYSVALQKDLAMQYDTHLSAEYVVKDGGNDISCHLQPIGRIEISGKVKDASTGLPLSGASVSASQTFAGKYGKTLNVKTDNKGVYSLSIANVPTSVAFAAADYVSSTMVCDSLLTGDSVLMPDVALKPITGATISVGFTYTDVSGATQNWFSDYQNVGFELFNVTKNRAIDQYNVQYPQIVLLEDVEDGDEIRITATSRTNTFMPVESKTAVIDQRAEATFDILELGQIQASFAKTGNALVVGSLYDASGKLVKTFNYANASLKISGLADGKYSLVSMGESRMFNTIYDLAQLAQSGLAEGTDYIVNSTEVKSGTIRRIELDEVPTLNESKLYYTGDNTSFTVNKPSIVAGNYLTMTGRIDFKPSYAGGVSNVQMIVDLPESCEFVDNSVMVGNNTSSYTINGNRITIPLARYTDRVRFCIIPMLGGEYVPSAFAQFDLNGETITQPIGAAPFEVKNLAITVPKTVVKSTVPVSGIAPPKSHVAIFDNNVKIGTATSLGNGNWSTNCELVNPYNLSRHSIYAIVTDQNGVKLQSETKECMYDRFAIELTKVTMYHDNPEKNTTYEVVFDFLNPSSEAAKYVYYIYNTQFTFTIDFTDNSPEKVGNVVLYVKTGKGRYVPLRAVYNEEKDIWVAVGNFGNMYDGDIPVNVSVDYSVFQETRTSASAVMDALYGFEKYYEQGKEIRDAFASLQKGLDSNTLSNEEFALEFEALTGVSAYSDESLGDMSYEDLLKYGEELIAESDAILGELSDRWDDLSSLTGYHVSDLTSIGCNASSETKSLEITENEAIEMGFSKIILDNDEYIYMLTDDMSVQVLDFSTGTHFIITYQLDEDMQAMLRAAGAGDLNALIQLQQQYNNYVEKMLGIVDKVNNVMDTALSVFDFAIESCGQAMSKNWALMKQYQQELKITNDPVKQDVLRGKIASLNNKNIELGEKQQSWLKSKEAGAEVLGKITSILSLVVDIYNFGGNIAEYIKLYFEVPFCECYPERTKELRLLVLQRGFECGVKDYANIAGDVISVMVAFNAISFAPATGGTSLIAGAFTIGANLLKILANQTADKIFAAERARIRDEIYVLAHDRTCNDCDDPEDDQEPDPAPDDKTNDPKNDITYPWGKGDGSQGGDHDSGSHDLDPSIDPSGYVYEGVFSNRVEGATATVFYKEEVEDIYGDIHENIVKWDAEEYAQENPLFTDENGFYRWDVPQGLWQVKFEKEGYETTQSEWLPVPPPQLEVNIAMKQNRQPEVKTARAYGDAVEVEFDKYMMPESLTAENISVMQNGKFVDGSVKLLNEEAATESSPETFASKVRFNAAQPFDAQEITLLVNNRVKSYAGVRMQDNFQQTFTVEQEIRRIVCDSVATVGYGEQESIMVSVLPPSASKGKIISVRTSSPMILSVDSEQVVIDDNGSAEILVSGQLPGTAALIFSVDGTDKTAMTIANVKQAVANTVANPKSNIASSTIVEKGTEIMLSCDTEGAAIYYTLDGSCPCDITDARKVYDGTPIVITDDITIKAMAVAEGMYDSDVVTFTYYVDGAGIADASIDELIEIYPVPVREKLNVRAAGKLIRKVVVSSVNGMLVAASSKEASEITINVDNIPAGIYIVNVTTDDGFFSRKILKVR